MTTYISILRGINVSGSKMIKMELLRKMFEELKFLNVRTYIQSGNVLFQSNKTEAMKISKLISSNIEKKFGYEVPVITFSQDELEKIIKANPFLKNKKMDTSFFHITFLSEIISKEKIELLNKVDLKNDKFEVINNAIYLYCPAKYSNSKLSNSFIERKLNVVATTRNWNTINQLLKISFE